MKVLIETSDKEKFESIYSEITKNSKITIKEDNISFGIEDTIVVGLVFIYNSVLSGITWDTIKGEILPYIKSLLKNKRKQDSISVSIRTPKNDFEIDIPEDFKELDLEVPEQLKLIIKK